MTEETLKRANTIKSEIHHLKKVYESLIKVEGEANYGLSFEITRERESANQPTVAVFIPYNGSKGYKAIGEGFVSAIKADMAIYISALESELVAL